jgi:hypothetical protein
MVEYAKSTVKLDNNAVFGLMTAQEEQQQEQQQSKT